MRFITCTFVNNNKNNEVKEDEMGGACNMHGEKRPAYWILVGKLEGKRPLERPSCRWVNNIKVDFGWIGWCGLY
jgi:hypothetical protein